MDSAWWRIVSWILYIFLSRANSPESVNYFILKISRWRVNDDCREWVAVPILLDILKAHELNYIYITRCGFLNYSLKRKSKYPIKLESNRAKLLDHRFAIIFSTKFEIFFFILFIDLAFNTKLNNFVRKNRFISHQFKEK